MALTNLPAAAKQYWSAIQASAQAYNVSPMVLVGIMWRESNAGLALTPPGPGGTGDFGTRPTSYYAGSNGLPNDGQGGWGRGLMQLDYAAQNGWFQSGADWRDPAVNIDKGAAVLAGNYSYFRAKGLSGDALDDAAIAAYNAGPGNVWSALSMGNTASSVTTGGDYADWVRNYIASLA